jgi:hypothetical protein
MIFLFDVLLFVLASPRGSRVSQGVSGGAAGGSGVGDVEVAQGRRGSIRLQSRNVMGGNGSGVSGPPPL